MEVIISNDGAVYSVKLVGRVDTTNADQFLKDITPLMDAQNPKITMDCSEMEYTSSQGLRMFLMLQKSVVAHQGSLELIEMRPSVKEVFDITGFSNIIKIR